MVTSGKPFGVALPPVIASLLRSPGKAYVVPDPVGAKPNKPPSSKRKQRRQFKRIPLRQIVRLLHRFVILCAAVVYIAISFNATTDAVTLLQEGTGEYTSEGTYTSEALGQHIGTTTMRESPFVVDGLQNDTRPRDAILYYNSSSMGFAVCPEMAPNVYTIYSTAFLQSLYAAIVRGTAYNLTFLAENTTELVVPVVDCTSYLVMSGDETMANFNFLVRNKNDIDDVYMLSVTFVNQVYKIEAQKEQGPAGVGTLTFINDLSLEHVDCHYVVSLGYPYEAFDFRVYEQIGMTNRGSWILRKIPNGDPSELTKVVNTGTRSGFYATSDSDQSNMFTEHWVISASDPISAITGPEWIIKSAEYDAWAWTHFLQLIFGLNLLSSLIVLVVVSYRNFLAGKLWIGDAFVAVSNRIYARVVLVLATWYINGFWTLFEFCVFDANQVNSHIRMSIYETIIFADLLTIYLSICGLLGAIFRERIDPCYSILCFWIGFANRIQMIHWSPSAIQALSEYSDTFYSSGKPNRVEGQTKIAPMRLWGLHELESVPINLVFTVLAPIFGTLALIVVFIVARKIYHYVYPDPLRVEKASTGTTAKSGNKEENVRDQKSVLTLFEIATGAKLANRFGLLAEYDNCLYIKGMKFATADGIYSSGFVIVNQKYLVQAEDIWAIVLMKIVRVRYTNIYMYEVNGSTVEQMARLVYPSTFTVADLLNLNTSILS